MGSRLPFPAAGLLLVQGLDLGPGRIVVDARVGDVDVGGEVVADLGGMDGAGDDDFIIGTADVAGIVE